MSGRKRVHMPSMQKTPRLCAASAIAWASALRGRERLFDQDGLAAARQASA